jgi:hypothetical protein
MRTATGSTLTSRCQRTRPHTAPARARPPRLHPGRPLRLTRSRMRRSRRRTLRHPPRQRCMPTRLPAATRSLQLTRPLPGSIQPMAFQVLLPSMQQLSPSCAEVCDKRPCLSDLVARVSGISTDLVTGAVRNDPIAHAAVPGFDARPLRLSAGCRLRRGWCDRGANTGRGDFLMGPSDCCLLSGDIRSSALCAVFPVLTAMMHIV